MFPCCFGIIPTRYHLPWDERQQEFCLPTKAIPLLVSFPFSNENFPELAALTGALPVPSQAQRTLYAAVSKGGLNRPKRGVLKLLPMASENCSVRDSRGQHVKNIPTITRVTTYPSSSLQHSEQVLEAHGFKIYFSALSNQIHQCFLKSTAPFILQAEFCLHFPSWPLEAFSPILALRKWQKSSVT